MVRFDFEFALISVSRKAAPTAASLSPPSMNEVIVDNDVEAGRGDGYDNEGYEKSVEDDANNATQVWVISPPKSH